MSSQLFELLFFAALAAFVAYRLYKTLGQEDDQDPLQKKPVNLKPAAKPRQNNGRIIDLEPITEVIPVTIPKVVATVLLDIQSRDPSFSIENFIQGARAAFEMIIAAYSKGDAETLQSLIAPHVLKPFIDDINERKRLSQSLETTLVSFVSCDISDAKLEGNQAQISLKYITRQVCLLKNDKGAIISGSPSDISRLEDIWTFERTLGSKDPNWILVATHS